MFEHIRTINPNILLTLSLVQYWNPYNNALWSITPASCTRQLKKLWFTRWIICSLVISICENLNHIKPTNKKLWLYQPQCISPWSWESISLDYINDLPTTQWNNDCIFLLVFSKIFIFIPSNKIIDAPTLARLFIQHIDCLS